MRDELLRHSISMQECSDLMVPARIGLIAEIHKKCEDIQDGAEKAEWEERYYLSDSIDDISDSEYKRLNKKLVNNQQFYDYLRSFNKPGYYNIQILVNLICDKKSSFYRLVGMALALLALAISLVAYNLIPIKDSDIAKNDYVMQSDKNYFSYTTSATMSLSDKSRLNEIKTKNIGKANVGLVVDNFDTSQMTDTFGSSADSKVYNRLTDGMKKWGQLCYLVYNEYNNSYYLFYDIYENSKYKYFDIQSNSDNSRSSNSSICSWEDSVAVTKFLNNSLLGDDYIDTYENLLDYINSEVDAREIAIDNIKNNKISNTMLILLGGLMSMLVVGAMLCVVTYNTRYLPEAYTVACKYSEYYDKVKKHDIQNKLKDRMGLKDKKNRLFKKAMVKEKSNEHTVEENRLNLRKLKEDLSDATEGIMKIASVYGERAEKINKLIEFTVKAAEKSKNPEIMDEAQRICRRYIPLFIDSANMIKKSTLNRAENSRKYLDSLEKILEAFYEKTKTSQSIDANSSLSVIESLARLDGYMGNLSNLDNTTDNE